MSNSGQSSEPRNSLEIVLVNVVAQVLELETVEIHDNFFELGGDSMKAADVAMLLQEFFQCDEAVLWAFIGKPTVAALADAVVEHAQCNNLSATADLIIAAMSFSS